MPSLPLAKPAEIGFDPDRLHKAFALLRSWADSDKIPSAGLAIGRKGKLIEPLIVGRQKPAKGAAAIRKDSLFLIASITKRLWPFGDDIAFVPGHGPMSTFGAERRTNPFVADQVLGAGA